MPGSIDRTYGRPELLLDDTQVLDPKIGEVEERDGHWATGLIRVSPILIVPFTNINRVRRL